MVGIEMKVGLGLVSGYVEEAGAGSGFEVAVDT